MIPVQLDGPWLSQTGTGVIWSHSGFVEERQRWLQSRVMVLCEIENGH
jgi:hypothetical protein